MSYLFQTNTVETASILLSKVFGEPVTLIRDHRYPGTEGYAIVLREGYFRDRAEQAVDEAWERNR